MRVCVSTTVADVCPRFGCNMPLMRSRQGRVVCCSCRADVVTHREGASTPPVANGPLTGTDVSNPTRTETSRDVSQPEHSVSIDRDDADDEENDDDGENNIRSSTEEGDQSAVKTEELSVGLSGSVGHVNGCSGEAGSGDHGHDCSDNDVTTSTASLEVPGVGGGQAADAADSRAMVPASASAASRDALSTALGDKLLRGWTLLSERCGACGVSLARSADGRIVCVGCGANPSHHRPSTSVTQHGATHSPAQGRELVLGSASATGRDRGRRDGADDEEGGSGIRLGNGLEHEHELNASRAVTAGGGVGGVRAVANTPSRAAVGPARPGVGGRLGTRLPAGGAATGTGTGTAAGGGGPLPAIADRAPVPAIEGRPFGAGAHARYDQSGADAFPIDDVDEQLFLSELAAAENLRVLRLRLPAARDVDARRAICTAMAEAARAIEAARSARREGMRVV